MGRISFLGVCVQVAPPPSPSSLADWCLASRTRRPGLVHQVRRSASLPTAARGFDHNLWPWCQRGDCSEKRPMATSACVTGCVGLV